MQYVVFHCFAYTCCTAFFQPFCGMAAIRYNVLYDRAFPHGCYRTLVKHKGSVFLGISVVCGGFLCFDHCFVGKCVVNRVNSLRKVCNGAYVLLNL